MLALLWRDIRLAYGQGSNVLTCVLFFAAVISITPFAIGPDVTFLARIAPGMLWIGALLATLLGLDRLFQIDREDGSLDLLILAHHQHPLAATVLVKCIAHWVGSVLPLIISAPLLGFMLNMPTKAVLAASLSLLVGTPAITLIGAVGAALAASLTRGGILISVMILPLSMPVLIFGVSAAYAGATPGASFLSPFLFLVALTLFFGVIGPYAASAALRYLSE